MAPIRRLVLDVLKPHEPPLPELATDVADTDGVTGANVSLVEIDRKVINVKLTLEGPGLDYEAIVDAIEAHGGTVHSIDEIATGEEIVESSPTPQD
jgi:hypothetical protein